MRKTQVRITMLCCLFAVAIFALAQSIRKPGLWEMTANMTWQQSPMPAGMAPPGTEPHTTEVCLTQAQIDRYGAPISQNRDCKIVNIARKPTGMTADLVCSGRMIGKGEVRASWTDSEHATGTIHFLGKMQVGPNILPVEWTVDSTSVYKGPDCGSVKPMQTPNN
jgi:hypothetical protein